MYDIKLVYLLVCNIQFDIAVPHEKSSCKSYFLENRPSQCQPYLGA